jgi:hypothetical protein
MQTTGKMTTVSDNICETEYCRRNTEYGDSAVLPRISVTKDGVLIAESVYRIPTSRNYN